MDTSVEWLDLTSPGAEWVSWPDLGTSRCCWPQVSDGVMSLMVIMVMSQVGMLESNIVVIGGEKRPSNTLETFDPKVSCLDH